MAETVLLKEPLTDGMFEVGARLIADLDQRKFPLVGALWLYDYENNRWNLLLATPLLDTDRLEAYQRLQEVEPTRSPHLRFGSVRLVSPSHEVIKGLTENLTPEFLGDGRRYSGLRLYLGYVEDSYIYRLPFKTPQT
jgi:hypothetical protein